MVAVSIASPIDAGEVRRVVLPLADSAGFDDTRKSDLAIVATELATNIARHARSGEVVARGVDGGVELLAIDKGPGMADLAQCMRDGYSTAGSLGLGLGAIGRLSSLLDIFTRAPGGTVICALVSQRSDRAPARRGFEIGAVSVPRKGELVCGDSWATRAIGDDKLRVMVADGLGHGPLASIAAVEAKRIFELATGSPSEVLADIHHALRATRGAVVAIAELDRRARTVTYTGLGNIAGFIEGAAKRTGMVSQHGTAGHAAGRMQTFTYAWPERSPVILHSDGVSQRWNLEDQPGLVLRNPALIAGVIYRDFSRTTDDATIVVVREGGP